MTKSKIARNSNSDLSQFSERSASSGLIERVVENWLTNATERGYQLAFCQMLAGEGEQLLYVAKHGPFEKGKDVVTRLADGRVRAYQLKGGDMKLGDWRGIDEQINNLVELPVNLPQLSRIVPHEPFLVTNGRVDDVVLDYINTANLGWKRRSFEYPLRVIELQQLVSRFVRAHGSFLPREAKDFQLLLTLMLTDGRAPLDKPKFATFLEGLVPFQDGVTAKNVGRALTSATLMTSYITGSAEVHANHWSSFEAWTMMASYILGAATRHNLDGSVWGTSYELAMLGAKESLDLLTEECKSREHFIEGHPIADGFFYGPRQLLLAGLLSARELLRRMSGGTPDQEVEALIQGRFRQAVPWGESAAPSLLLAALEIERQSLQPFAEHKVLEYLQFILALNDEQRQGCPDSFTGLEDSLRFLQGMSDHRVRTSQGFSYVCQCLIDFLARRWRRRALAGTWEKITHLSLVASMPQDPWDWFRWEAPSAVLKSHFAGQPESWKSLLADAEQRKHSTLPTLLCDQPDFVLLYLLVFPHRLTPETLALVESVL